MPHLAALLILWLVGTLSALAVQSGRVAYERLVRVTLAPPDQAGSIDVNIVVDSTQLISTSRLDENCFGVSVFHGGSLVPHWLEGGCGTTAASIWVRVKITNVDVRVGGILLTFQFEIFPKGSVPRIRDGHIGWDGGYFVLPFVTDPSTDPLRACPDGMKRDKPINYHGRHLMTGGSSEQSLPYGAKGGSATHYHSGVLLGPSRKNDTCGSGMTDVAPEESLKGLKAGWPPFGGSLGSHKHTLSIDSTADASVRLPSFGMSFCRTMQMRIDARAVMLTTSPGDLLPSFQRSSVEEMDGMFPCGCHEPRRPCGSQLGNSSHLHVDVLGTTEKLVDATVFSGGAFAGVSKGSSRHHRHFATSDQSSESTNHIPPFYNVVPAVVDDSMLLSALVGAEPIFLARYSPPLGYVPLDIPERHYLRFAGQYDLAGSTGGSPTHSHTFDFDETAPASDSGQASFSPGSVLQAQEHSHPIVSGVTCTGPNLPPYYVVRLFRRLVSPPVRWEGEEVVRDIEGEKGGATSSWLPTLVLIVVIVCLVLLSAGLSLLAGLWRRCCRRSRSRMSEGAPDEAELLDDPPPAEGAGEEEEPDVEATALVKEVADEVTSPTTS